MKSYIIILLLCCSIYSIAQDYPPIRGKVSGPKEALIGAQIHWKNSSIGTTSDASGNYSIAYSQEHDSLVFSYIGHTTQTFHKKDITSPFHIVLKQSGLLKTVEIEAKSESKEIAGIGAFQLEKLNKRELKKAACCNLSESFETNPSVDVNFADAVSGAKRIKLLGLDGIYSLITIENMPDIRGLSASYGLSMVPGSWIESIQLAKGVGSVVNGYEALTGQINVELTKAIQGPKLHLNSYVNHLGRAETSLHSRFDVTKKWSTALMAHGSLFSTKVDPNKDGFIDLPTAKQAAFSNRWKYYGDKIESQIGVDYFAENRLGGQKGFDRDQELTITNPWGFNIDQHKLNAYAKIGILPTDKHPDRSLGFINKFSTYGQDGTYGLKKYEGQNSYFYSNLIFSDRLFSKETSIKTGISFIQDNYDETLIDMLHSETYEISRNESTVGFFGEFSYTPNERFTLVTGLRTDYNNLFGWFATPRVHARYKLKRNLSWRVAVGSGQRTPNLFVDNAMTFVSSRRIVIPTELKQEKAWNFGTSLLWDTKLAKKDLVISMDVYHTEFSNKLLMDMDQSGYHLFKNLDGRAYASVAQVEINYAILKRLDLRFSHKIQEVKSVFNAEEGLEYVPFAPKNKSLINIAYATNARRWVFDLTAIHTQPGEIPNSITEPTFDPPKAYWRLNSQITFRYKSTEIYLGGENLTGFTQKNPIIDAENPFEESFDAGNTWAPIFGEIIYLGIRFTLL